MSGILLIDAEQPFADQMVSALRGRGFSVKHLDDGKDGLDFARDSRPDLIVLCVELPKMSGYSICNKLKKDGDLKNIPLLITSKEATPETFAQHKKLKTRAEEYLIKPFSEQDLLEKIGSLIPMPSGGANVPATSTEGDPFAALDALGGGEMRLDASQLEEEEPAQPRRTSGSDGMGLSAEEEAMLAGLDTIGKGNDDMAAHALSLDEELPDLGGSVPDDNLLGFDQAFEALATVNVSTSDQTPSARMKANDPFEALDKAQPPPPAREERPPPPEPASSEGRPVVEAVRPTPPPPPAPTVLSTPPPVSTPSERERSSSSISMAASSLSSSSSSSSSAADLAQIQALRRESADLKSKVAELEARLRASEDAARAAQTASAAAGSSSSGSAREVLNLKEQLRAKDKELSAMKDEVFEKEKGNVDLLEEIDRHKAEAAARQSAFAAKDAELAALQARVKAVTEERDELEQQVHGRLQQVEQERDRMRGELEKTRFDFDKTKTELGASRSDAERLRAAEERTRAELEDQRRQAALLKTTTDAKTRELETAARDHEQRYLKAYQRLKHEETLREKAKKAVEIAFTVLSGDVENSSDSKSSDLDQLGAE
jgi:CheY-like chemotaxis protein